MARLSPILRSLDRASRKTLIFWCPGCDSSHSVPVERDGDKPSWTWDGSVEAPTFSPSLLIRSGHYVPSGPAGEACCYCKRNAEKRAAGEEVYFECGVCHSFVEAGMIRFLSDCTHALAGRTVPLPIWATPYGGTDGE